MKKMMLIIVLGLSLQIDAQSVQIDSTQHDSVANLKFKYRQLIIPTILIGYGIVGIESDQLKFFNSELRDEIVENIDERITIDDFMQFAPTAAVYTLNGVGYHGKNNFRDRTVVMATSYLILSAAVFSLKGATKIERPDGMGNDSFPSGHTANAFAGAEFLYQEYKERSIWYGVAGYAVATGTGVFRMHNNRHWLTDVVAGAGIGILSTKAAYWLQPYLCRQLFDKKHRKTVSVVMPFYSSDRIGLSFVRTF